MTATVPDISAPTGTPVPTPPAFARFILIQALGVLCAAAAYAIALHLPVLTTLAEALRWFCLLVLFGSTALLIRGERADAQQRLTALVVLSLALYVVKVLYSPLEFRFSDEMQHWRSTTALLTSGSLFQFNPILPIGASYPGLHVVTSAVAALTGLSVFHAGLLVVALARLAGALALFVLYERLGGSARVAGLAALIYMTNPHYLFFSAYFAYQSLALPLLFVTLCAAVCALDDRRWRWLYLAASAAVIVTHHITGFALIGLLAVWALVARLLGDRQWRRVGMMGVWAGGLALVWTLTAARDVTAYLSPYPALIGGEVERLLSGQAAVASASRLPDTPLLEQLLSVAAVGCMTLLVVAGYWRVWRERRMQPTLLVAFALASTAYFAMLVVRLVSSAGVEVAGRSFSYTFLLAAPIAALVLVRGAGRWALPIVLLLAVGGVASGVPPWWGRLPGGYLAGAAERSVDAPMLAFAAWAQDDLPDNLRIGADHALYHLLGSYGEQFPVFGAGDVIAADTLGSDSRRQLTERYIDYIAIDRRIGLLPAQRASYFGAGETQLYRDPLTFSALDKFDLTPGVSRIFDGGDVVLYGVERLHDDQE